MLPKVHVWVMWMPTEVPNILALDRTHGVFDAGMQFLFTHELVVKLAEMLKDHLDVATASSVLLRTRAVGPMQRRIEDREDRLFSVACVLARVVCVSSESKITRAN